MLPAHCRDQRGWTSAAPHLAVPYLPMRGAPQVRAEARALSLQRSLRGTSQRQQAAQARVSWSYPQTTKGAPRSALPSRSSFAGPSHGHCQASLGSGAEGEENLLAACIKGTCQDDSRKGEAVIAGLWISAEQRAAEVAYLGAFQWTASPIILHNQTDRSTSAMTPPAPFHSSTLRRD